MASSVANHLTTHTARKSHGGWKYYRDDRIDISLDTYVPNINVKIMLDGEWQEVYSAGYHNHDRPNRYKPGKWTQYLEELAATAGEARQAKENQQAKRDQEDQERRYGAIDDGATFGQVPMNQGNQQSA